MAQRDGRTEKPTIRRLQKAREKGQTARSREEYHWENSTPEVGQCIGFVRGYGMAKKW